MHYFILPIIFVNFVNIKQKLLCNVTCSGILPVSVFCVLQGSGLTPVKCCEIYDIDFVANFMENTTVKYVNWSTFVKVF